MQFDRHKLKEVVHYTCHKCDADRLGAVKLHKVLYFSDMIKYVTEGTAITGAVYRKRPFGPTCDALLSVITEMEQEQRIAVTHSEYFGYVKKQYVSRQEPKLSRLNDRELRLLDEVIAFVCDRNSARTISEFSHSRPWEMVEFGEEIPYRSAYNLFPNDVTQDSIDWAEGELEGIAHQRSGEDAVGYEDYTAFRDRLHEKRRRV